MAAGGGSRRPKVSVSDSAPPPCSSGRLCSYAPGGARLPQEGPVLHRGTTTCPAHRRPPRPWSGLRRKPLGAPRRGSAVHKHRTCGASLGCTARRQHCSAPARPQHTRGPRVERPAPFCAQERLSAAAEKNKSPPPPPERPTKCVATGRSFPESLPTSSKRWAQAERVLEGG